MKNVWISAGVLDKDEQMEPCCRKGIYSAKEVDKYRWKLNFKDASLTFLMLKDRPAIIIRRSRSAIITHQSVQWQLHPTLMINVLFEIYCKAMQLQLLHVPLTSILDTL